MKYLLALRARCAAASNVKTVRVWPPSQQEAVTDR